MNATCTTNQSEHLEAILRNLLIAQFNTLTKPNTQTYIFFFIYIDIPTPDTQHLSFIHLFIQPIKYLSNTIFLSFAKTNCYLCRPLHTGLQLPIPLCKVICLLLYLCDCVCVWYLFSHAPFDTIFCMCYLLNWQRENHLWSHSIIFTSKGCECNRIHWFEFNLNLQAGVLEYKCNKVSKLDESVCKLCEYVSG